MLKLATTTASSLYPPPSIVCDVHQTTGREAIHTAGSSPLESL
jgi:hypothetical protein